MRKTNCGRLVLSNPNSCNDRRDWLNGKLCLSLAGIMVSAALVALALHRIDWAVFVIALKKLTIAWLLPAGFIILGATMIRSLRWWFICGTSPLHHFWSFWRAQTFGCVGNLFFPAKAGELIRVVALRRFAGVPGAHALSSGIMDRLADGLGAVLLLFVAISRLPIEFLQGRALIGFALLFGSLAVLSIVFIVWGGQLSVCMPRFTGRLSIIGDGFSKRYLQAFHAAQHLRRPGRLVIIECSTLLAFACDTMAAWLTMVAFGWHLPFSSGLVLILFLAIATSLPSAPAYVGIYQIACVFALRLYQVGDSDALAYSVVLQIVTFCTVLLQAAVMVFNHGFHDFHAATHTPLPELTAQEITF